MSEMKHQQQRAQEFLALHTAGPILVLLNAWDVASARLFAAAGARAVGTTSMGIAASMGLPDEQVIGLERMLARVQPIAEAVDVPVSADMEAGYGATTDEVVAAVQRAVACGVVGINLEDGSGDASAPLLAPEVLAERIAAIREATRAAGLHLVLNARTDVVLQRVGNPAEQLRAVLARGQAYRAAGADCVFVPGGLERDTIRTLVAELGAPLNVVANPAIAVPIVPSVPELRDMGVARVSVGSGMMRAALGFTHRAALQVLGEGTYGVMAGELQGAAAHTAYDIAVRPTPRRS